MKKRRIISLLCATVILAAGCSFEPMLWLRTAVNAAFIMQAKININLMWQINWETKWTFRWNAAVNGPLGYTEPEGMRVHVYNIDADGEHKYHSEINFYGTTADIPVFYGTYDLLFHNNDSEVLLFRTAEGSDEIESYTRVFSRGLRESAPVLTPTQKEAVRSDVKGPEEEPVALMPDGLFSLFDEKHVITDNLSEYDFIDGKYVIRIEGELIPRTFIYLIQVHLLNNGDRVVGSPSGAALTGVAESVNLCTGMTSSETVSVPMDMLFDAENDMFGAKMFTYGIPGCNPYDDASVAASVSNHFLVINVMYGNGTYKNIRVDVTDQIRALPLGGVVTLDVDVNDFPPDGGTPGGGGFDPLIDDWHEETGGTTIIE